MLFHSNQQQMFLVLVLIVSAINFGLSNVTDLEDSQLIIDLPNGKIRGKLNGDFYSYESIPYAEPPVGKLRFESPKPYKTAWQGIRDATQKPVPCMQWDQYVDDDNKLHGVEDCLTVNVYKPSLATANTTLPVLVLIHGGAFMFGTAILNNHERVLKRKHFIVAKMNYRLGPLGFLSTEDAVIPGNFGLKDQRLALQWIKSNIARFGGDPERMIVLGFSSGGAAVHLQMLQKNFTQYAKVAASFSGTAFNPWVIQRNTRTRAIALAKGLDCPNSKSSVEIKRCLQSKDAVDIVRAVRNFLVFGYNPFTTFGPVIETSDVEDAFLNAEPEDIVRSGEFAQLPWLVSYAAQDGGYNAAELLQTVTHGDNKMMIDILNERWFELAPQMLFFKNNIASIAELNDYSKELRNRYLGANNFSFDTYFDVQRMYTDVLFKNGVEKSVRLQREFSKSPVYAYTYDNPADKGIGTELSKRKDIKFGTVHGDDFFLIFPVSGTVTELSQDKEIMSNKLIEMLERFLDNSQELSFDSCQFVDNVGKKNLQLMKITKDACDMMSVERFP